MMTTDAVVRAWAKDSGVDVPARGQVPKGVRDQYDAANPPPDNPGLSVDGPPSEHGYAETEPMPTRPVGHADEVAPTRAPTERKGFTFRRPRATPGARAAKATHKRVSLEGVCEGAWNILGNMIGSQGLVPTGRVLKLQAPIAGAILEDAVKGTVIDRLAQPLARHGEATKELGALLGVPIIVTMMTVKPQSAQQLLPTLKRSLREWAIIAGPRIKAREKREEKALEQLGVDAKGLDELVDTWVAALFAAVDEDPEAADGE
jgi:hypothetical protein